MPLKIAAFPKCYIDRIAGERTMSVFDWIEMARSLDADGLEMYDGFFESLDGPYLDRVGEAIRAAGFAMPMLCCSPDFTNPDPDARSRAVDREAEMIRVTRRLGGAGAVCRVLSGQRYPGLGRREGLDRVVSMHASDRYLAEGTTLDDLREADGTLGYSANLRHGVTGQGLNDYHAIFRILAAHGYRGWISIEDGMNGMDEMARSLAFLRAMAARYFPEG